MNKTTPRSVLLLAALALLCAAPSLAQFQKYVALGDSLTAGFQSGCLVARNQQTSFPAVLAHTLGISDFQQPLVQEVVFSDPAGMVCRGPALVNGAITVVPVSQMGGPLNAALPRPYDNLGLPGFQVADLTEFTHGNPNGNSKEKISALVLRNVPGSPFDGTNAVQQADQLLGQATGDTLVSLWIGNNDVLGAATSGIVVDGVTLTTAADFQGSYEAILAGLLPSTRMVAANIPDVTAIPFTTTIPPVVVNPATLQPVLVDGHPVSLLGPGNASFPCTLPGGADLGCALPPGTLVNLPASSLLAQGIGIPTALGGTGLPLPYGRIDETGPHMGVLLYPNDVALLQSRTEEYNAIIASSLPAGTLWDANGFFDEIRTHGYEIGGLDLTTQFVRGGLFSYDGVHPSNIGYTIVADNLIATLNAEGDVVYPRPNFSSALFDPNVPEPVSNVPAEIGGPWNYTFSTWRSVLSAFAPKLGLEGLPELDRIAKRPGRSTRTVNRRGAEE